MIYVDTSIVVSALDMKHPKQRGKATELLATKAEKVVSELFLLELSSALSRRGDLISAVTSQLEASPAAVVAGYITYVMSKYGLKFVETPGDKVFTAMGRLRTEMATAIGYSTTFKLRSLDLMHLAYLLLLKERGYPVEMMLTSDREFLKVEAELEQRGVKLMTPQGS